MSKPSSTLRTLWSILPGLALASCSGGPVGTAEPIALSPVRGFVLISIDTLRADSTGLHAPGRRTTPFLDRLAERSTVFENAFVQVPGTLPSHMSMFTGLYPTEHAVFPPAGVLDDQVPTLPELFRDAGYRAFGHSEGGYVSGGAGFRRGFEEWTETAYEDDTDIRRTFDRGLESLSRLAADEKFFLFLHTYSVHDPYRPPASYHQMFWPDPPPAGALDPTGPNFHAFNAGLLDGPDEAVPYYRALYEAGVRYMDDEIARLFAGLDRLGLAADTVVVFTSDHGEEFLDHGRLAHTQAYPEELRVPLIIFDPRRPVGRRVSTIVESIDLLPTLAELGGFRAPVEISGESFAQLLAGGDGRLAGRAFAQNEFLAIVSRTLLLPVGGSLHQLHISRPILESDGYWVARETSFDVASAELEFRAAAFHQPRQVTVRADGKVIAELEIGTAWKGYRVELPRAVRQVVSMRSSGCTSPAQLGASTDPRCLSFKLDGVDLTRIELFDLGTDPLAQHDLSTERSDLLRTLVRELKKYPETARFEAHTRQLSDEQVANLKALGYLQ